MGRGALDALFALSACLYIYIRLCTYVLELREVRRLSARARITSWLYEKGIAHVRKKTSLKISVVFFYFYFLFVLRLCGRRCFGEIWNLIVGVWYGNQICIKSIMRAADTFMMSLIFIKYYKVVV